MFGVGVVVVWVVGGICVVMFFGDECGRWVDIDVGVD